MFTTCLIYFKFIQIYITWQEYSCLFLFTTCHIYIHIYIYISNLNNLTRIFLWYHITISIKDSQIMHTYYSNVKILTRIFLSHNLYKIIHVNSCLQCYTLYTVSWAAHFYIINQLSFNEKQLIFKCHVHLKTLLCQCVYLSFIHLFIPKRTWV